MSKLLFEEESDSDSYNIKLTTNKDYAKSYNKFRQKEIVQRLKDQGRDGSDLSTSESDSSDDDDNIENPEFDEEFFKTLAFLKAKDPKIYNKDVKFFEKFDALDKQSNEAKKERKNKPFTVKDLERKVILEKGGVYEDDEEDEESEKRPQSPSMVEKEQELKQAFKKVLEENDSEEEEFGGIFKKRNRSKEEAEKEEKQYAKWLAGQSKNIGEDAKLLAPLKHYWNNPTLPRDEAFLRDYVLNKGFGENSDQIPTYDEIVGNYENIQLSDDEKDLETQAEFEHKYNFRFEEPDEEFIKRYPRTIEHSVRNVSDKRKQKRAEIRERKQREKEQRHEELQILKTMKRKEIEEKINKLKQVIGNEELPFDDDDFLCDFDPEEHDKKMQRIFNAEYYGIDEGEQKPECPSDIEDLKVDDWDNYDPKKDGDSDENVYEPHCEDTEFNMDCDYDPTGAAKKSLEEELIENSRGRKKRKRKSKFVEILKKDKPIFDPEDEKTYAEYIDEYYKLDYEDMIGDIPCRFKYVETVPNDFGLSVEEILLAKNKELNQWASLKKAVQIRPKHIELNEVKQFKTRANNENLKKKILKSIYQEKSDDDDENDEVKEEEREEKNNEPNQPTTLAATNRTTLTEEVKTKKKKKKLKKAQVQTATVFEADERKSVKSGDVEEKSTDKSINAKQNKKRKQEMEFDIVDSQQIGVETKKLKLDETIPLKSTMENSIPRKKKKKNKQNTAEQQNNSKSTVNGKVQNGKNNIKNDKFNAGNNKKQNKFFNHKRNDQNIDKSISDNRLRAFGINPRKYHNKQKYGNNNNEQNRRNKSNFQRNKKKNFHINKK